MWLVTGALVRMKEWGLQKRRGQGCQVWLSRFCTARPSKDAQSRPTLCVSGKEYRSRLPFRTPRGLPNPGIEPGSPALQADALSLYGQENHHANLGRFNILR